jgi:hypothetical protein
MIRPQKLSYNAGYNMKHFMLDRAIEKNRNENIRLNADRAGLQPIISTAREEERFIPKPKIIPDREPIVLKPTNENLKQLSLLEQIKGKQNLRPVILSSGSPDVITASIGDQIKSRPTLRPTITREPEKHPISPPVSGFNINEILKANPKFQTLGKQRIHAETEEDWGTGKKKRKKRNTKQY